MRARSAGGMRRIPAKTMTPPAASCCPAQEDAIDTFPPFEGDRMFSVIQSKALMLAADDKISDPASCRS